MSDFYLKDIERIKEFLEIKGKKLLFYHTDSDGVCSGSLLMKFYPGFEPYPRRGPEVGERFAEFIIRKNPDAVAFFDLPVDQYWKAVTKISKALPKSQIFILDHHIPTKNLNSKKIIHVNPMFSKKLYLPTCYLIYKILKGLDKPMEDFLWIPAMGIIADRGLEDTKDFSRNFKKLYPDLISKNPLESEISNGIELISSAITLKSTDGVKEVFEIILNAKSYKEFADVKRLKDYKEIVDREIKRLVENFEKEKEYYPEKKLILYVMKTNLSLASTISNIISDKNPDKVVIIANPSPEGHKISLRSQKGKVNVGLLAKKCTKKIGSGGGHEQAAGAFVKNFDLFKKRVLRELGKK